MRIRLIVTVAVAHALLAAAPAFAGTASMTFSGHNTRPQQEDVYTFKYAPAAGEASRLVVTLAPGATVRVEDTGAPLAPGTNCRSDGPNAVVCTPDQTAPGAPARVYRAELDLGDGNDRLALNELGATVTAGAGDDEVIARGAPITVEGGPGADLMRGPLPSTITYEGRTGDVKVIQDGQANDGEPGEHDNVGPGFSFITGGDGDDELHLDGPNPSGLSIPGTAVEGRAGDDRLFGTDSGDRMEGGAGDDQLHAGAGTDTLLGGPGADVFRGGADIDYLNDNDYMHNQGPLDVTLDDRPGDGPPGENDDIGSDVENVSGTRFNDRFVGSENADSFHGNGGHDTIDGRGGADWLDGAGHIVGGPGEDTITVFEGENPLTAFPATSLDSLDGERDEIWCSPGTPELRVDPFDTLDGCAPAVIGPKPERFRATRSGTVRMRVRCAPKADIPCAGKLYVLHGDFSAPVAARGRFALPANGSSAVVEARLTRAYLARLRRERRLTVIFQLVTYRKAPAPSKRITYTPSQIPFRTPGVTLLAPRR